MADDIKKVDFRGEVFEVNVKALHSIKVQKDISLMGSNPEQGFRSLDLVLCGKLDDCFSRIKEEDGSLSEFGCSDAAFADFVFVVAGAAEKK